MWYFIIIVSVIMAGFFIWSGADYRRQKREREKGEDKPPFRSEQDLDEYGKSMEDGDYNPIDFGDTE